MYITDLKNGLSETDIQIRKEQNLTNKTKNNLTRSNAQIIMNNIFTLFNMLNLVIAILISITGVFNNLFFLGPVIVNTFFGTYQELRAKRELDKISLFNEHEISVIRNHKISKIKKESLVKDDVIILNRGEQVPADGIIRKTDGFEVNESSLTGEPNSVNKEINDTIFSGSYVDSGQALIQLTNVGKDSFISKLSLEVKREKHKVSFLMRIINNIVRLLTYTLIPLGLALFLSSYSRSNDLNQSILGTSGLLIGIIPEGLVLLTTIALSVGAINLSRKKTLVKSLNSIETLARVDVLCLDKTGTITTGNLKISDVVSVSNSSKESIIEIAKNIAYLTNESNQTANAIKEFPAKFIKISYTKIFPFSSERKNSGFVDKKNNTYKMGALEYIVSKPDVSISNEVNKLASKGKRVLSITKNDELLGFLVITDEIRKEAKYTFNYLSDQGIKLKIISGDNPLTASNVAQQVGIKNSDKYIDLSELKDKINYSELVKNYTVFGRVKPEQKKFLIQALQNSGSTVGMTGDGVNDILAMKEADCSIAISGGSDAADSTADFVFLNQKFDSMTYVLNEGRRVINNIERVASLYLMKTIYSFILAVIFIFMNSSLPFHPSQMTPVNALTVGIPTFLLALQPDYSSPKGKFLRNILEIALPAAFDIVFGTMILTHLSHVFNLDYIGSSTLIILLISSIGFSALWNISMPMNIIKISVFIILMITMLLIFIFSGNLFSLENPFNLNIIIYSLCIIFISYPSFKITKKIFNKFTK